MIMIAANGTVWGGEVLHSEIIKVSLRRTSSLLSTLQSNSKQHSMLVLSVAAR